MTVEEVEVDALVAEMIGTLALVFFGGLAVMQSDSGELDLLGVAIANMLVLIVMVYFGFRFSGAHYNPAITLSMVATRKLRPQDGVMYIVAQLLGSVLGGLLIQILATDSMITESKTGSQLGYPHLTKGYDAFQGMIFELVLTFFLVFVIWAMVVDDKAPPHMYGFAYGGMVGLAILIGGPITGAAMNPARVFGPSLVIGSFTDQWIYYVGPILGGILAGLFYANFYLNPKPEKNK